MNTVDREWDAPYFTGVISVNIYCFPWCKEQAEQEPTIQFKSRAEAERAGYRSCKTCCSGLPPGSWKDTRQEVILIVPREFNFTENLKYLSNAPNECLYHIRDQRIYKAIPVEQETPVIEIRADNDNTLIIRFLGDTGPPPRWVRAAVARYVRDWFDLETDLRPFYDLAQSDRLLRRAMDSFYGLRNIGIPDLFEAISWGIIGQQINLTFAYTLKRRLVETFGRYVEHEGVPYWLFPTPHQIAALTMEDLVALRISVRKCEYLLGVAHMIVEGELSKDRLWSAGDDEKMEKMLTQVRGIGPWTAHYVLMRCLRIPSAFPIDDVGLQNAIKYLLGTEKKPTKSEILQLSSNWTNWESYATFYLWRFLY